MATKGSQEEVLDFVDSGVYKMDKPIKGFDEEGIRSIYDEVKDWVRQNYGTSGWYWEDWFADKGGYEYFKWQMERDNEIKDGMTKDEVVEVIEQCLGQNIFLSNAEQAMLASSR